MKKNSLYRALRHPEVVDYDERLENEALKLERMGLLIAVILYYILCHILRLYVAGLQNESAGIVLAVDNWILVPFIVGYIYLEIGRCHKGMVGIHFAHQRSMRWGNATIIIFLCLGSGVMTGLFVYQLGVFSDNVVMPVSIFGGIVVAACIYGLFAVIYHQYVIGLNESEDEIRQNDAYDGELWVGSRMMKTYLSSLGIIILSIYSIIGFSLLIQHEYNIESKYEAEISRINLAVNQHNSLELIKADSEFRIAAGSRTQDWYASVWTENDGKESSVLSYVWDNTKRAGDPFTKQLAVNKDGEAAEYRYDESKGWVTYIEWENNHDSDEGEDWYLVPPTAPWSVNPKNVERIESKKQGELTIYTVINKKYNDLSEATSYAETETTNIYTVDRANCLIKLERIGKGIIGEGQEKESFESYTEFKVTDYNHDSIKKEIEEIINKQK